MVGFSYLTKLFLCTHFSKLHIITLELFSYTRPVWYAVGVCVLLNIRATAQFHLLHLRVEWGSISKVSLSLHLPTDCMCVRHALSPPGAIRFGEESASHDWSIHWQLLQASITGLVDSLGCATTSCISHISHIVGSSQFQAIPLSSQRITILNSLRHINHMIFLEGAHCSVMIVL